MATPEPEAADATKTTEQPEPVPISDVKEAILATPPAPQPVPDKTVLTDKPKAAIPAPEPAVPAPTPAVQKKPVPQPPAQPSVGIPDPPPYRPRDPYIAVLGETGVGKTTFISEATGLDMNIGHSLDSCTEDVGEFVTTIDGRHVTLIDTPGFNDTRRSDSDILEIIGTYLRYAYRKDIQLTAVIYIQRITEPRVRGSAVHSLRLLKNLCGEGYYGNIVLVTVGWTDPPLDKHVKNEDQLRRTDIYWGDFLREGATVQRHTTGAESALAIMEHVLKKTPSVLQFQQELAKVGIIGKTKAGEQVIVELARQREEDQNEINRLRLVLDDSKARKEELEKEIVILKDKLDTMGEQIQNLNTKLDDRVKWVPQCRAQ